MRSYASLGALTFQLDRIKLTERTLRRIFSGVFFLTTSSVPLFYVLQFFLSIQSLLFYFYFLLVSHLCGSLKYSYFYFLSCFVIPFGYFVVVYYIFYLILFHSWTLDNQFIQLVCIIMIKKMYCFAFNISHFPDRRNSVIISCGLHRLFFYLFYPHNQQWITVLYSNSDAIVGVMFFSSVCFCFFVCLPHSVILHFLITF